MTKWLGVQVLWAGIYHWKAWEGGDIIDVILRRIQQGVKIKR
jgi:hypothetical protein